MSFRTVQTFAVALCAVLAIGCGGSKTKAPVNESDVPDFVLNPPKEKGVLFGTGISEQASMQLAKETADLRARKEIANQLSTKIANMLKDFMGQNALGSEAEVTEAVSSTTRAISEVELVGVTIERREYKKGKMYSLGKYPLDGSMKDMISKQVNKALSSQQALLSAFRSKQGFEELDKELDKMKAE